MIEILDFSFLNLALIFVIHMHYTWIIKVISVLNSFTNILTLMICDEDQASIAFFIDKVASNILASEHVC